VSSAVFAATIACQSSLSRGKLTRANSTLLLFKGGGSATSSAGSVAPSSAGGFFGGIPFVALVTENKSGSNHGNGKSRQQRPTMEMKTVSNNGRNNRSVRDDNKNRATVAGITIKIGHSDNAATAQSSVMTIKLGNRGNNEKHNSNSMESLTVTIKTMEMNTVAVATAMAIMAMAIDRCCHVLLIGSIIFRRGLTNAGEIFTFTSLLLYQEKIWRVLYKKFQSYKRNLYGALKKSTL
jgi:hypothetical protein